MHYPDSSFPVPLIRLVETDSTSRSLTSLCKQSRIEEFTVVLSDFQTAGRGQQDNTWEAEKGKNLLFSFVLYPSFLEARNQFLLSQIIALSVKEELDEWASGFSVKWPNDIYWENRKVCGILIENDLLGSRIERSIAGIGLNINQKEFHSPAPNPVSLTQITGNAHDLLSILGRLMERCIRYYELLRQGEKDTITERYRQSLFWKEGLHPYADKNGTFTARVIRVNPGGALILEDESGREREYAFKEVKHII
ncbi:Bifunctional ligase/repressor BirA [termite gut metagenome]|uniref:Bifunctional ligase/repressor BirA n=1 Tax=termite gut metagenome TaxID=433724 RepID=A0A5J4SNJ5_9ZZZZ